MFWALLARYQGVQLYKTIIQPFCQSQCVEMSRQFYTLGMTEELNDSCIQLCTP